MKILPDLRSYDWICVSSSAGKDSQAMLDYVVSLADKAGVRDRIVVIHADLGRVEWEGTQELAESQADYYGLRFEVVSRIGGTATRGGKTYAQGEKYGDLLDYVERRGAWPDNKNRYCTSDFKRGPILKKYTELTKEWKEATGNTRACRILECMGLRSEESRARAKKVVFEERKSNRNQHIDTWLPIHEWTEKEVWDTIHESGAPYHPAYDLGMPRLSCAFCIFAPKAALVIAGKHNRKLLEEYVEVEKKIDHTFRTDVSLADVLRKVQDDEQVDASELHAVWNM